MLLEDEIERRDPPTVAIYNSIPDHICRNYLRPTWLTMLSRNRRAHPHFELLNGEPVFRGLVTVKDAVHDEAALRRKELDLTAAFITGMHERAARKGVRFFVVLLPQRFDVACGSVAWPPSLVRSLTESGVEFLDLSEVKGKMTWLEHDAHPDPKGHRVLAAAIAGSFIGNTLSEIAGRRAQSK
jgi:hypothetical protein